MLCESCKKNEATVHITKIINGVKKELNLCEKCANENGEFNFVPQIDFFSAPFTFQNVLSGMMDYIGNSNNTAQYNFNVTCSNCNLNFEEFKRTGLVGCSNCYKNFGSTLIPIIKRVQGNLEHTGKIPKRVGKNLIHKNKLLELKNELQKCIDNEEYEKAAKIRDEIKEINKE
ncbi:UvrB/UvrC motif-containing protein [Clostridium sp. JN-1]|jgi:protein arginine kinase activator|uniref:UvrB/UvrC motif-containing protein n=1 Tax=Clostridium sp. JN-1 TaxID=2483110 RepID=UPI000F0B4FDE|nr:UvrB/UvrC motif-containing protein [Clostridium sp. JN-1]